MSDKIESLDPQTRDCIKKALKYLESNRPFWNGPQHQCAWTLRDLLGEEAARPSAPKGG